MYYQNDSHCSCVGQCDYIFQRKQIWKGAPAKNDLFFDNCICYQNCNCDMVSRDDTMLAPCDSHLWAVWAMQSLWSTATIN